MMISLGSLPKLYPKRENNDSKSFLHEIAFGQQNQGVPAMILRETLMKTLASSQSQWEMIPCIAVSFTWLRPIFYPRVIFFKSQHIHSLFSRDDCTTKIVLWIFFFFHFHIAQLFNQVFINIGIGNRSVQLSMMFIFVIGSIVFIYDSK